MTRRQGKKALQPSLEEIGQSAEHSLERMRWLVGLIAREHGLEPPAAFAGSFTVGDLLAFLQRLGEPPSVFFAIAFGPLSGQPALTNRGVETGTSDPRATLLAIDDWLGSLERWRRAFERSRDSSGSLVH